MNSSVFDVNKPKSVCVGRQASVHICCGSGSYTPESRYKCNVCHTIYPWFDTHGGVTRDSRYSEEGFTRAGEGKQLFGTQPVARHDQGAMQSKQLTQELIVVDLSRPPPFSNGHGSLIPGVNPENRNEVPSPVYDCATGGLSCSQVTPGHPTHTYVKPRDTNLSAQLRDDSPCHVPMSRTRTGHDQLSLIDCTSVIYTNQDTCVLNADIVDSSMYPENPDTNDASEQLSQLYGFDKGPRRKKIWVMETVNNTMSLRWINLGENSKTVIDERVFLKGKIQPPKLNMRTIITPIRAVSPALCLGIAGLKFYGYMDTGSSLNIISLAMCLPMKDHIDVELLDPRDFPEYLPFVKVFMEN